MAYLFLVCYLAAILIRPHEWFAVGAASPVIRISVMLTFFTYILTQENKKMAPQYMLVMFMAGAIAMSSALNGWIGGAIHANVQFLPASLLPLIICGGLITSANKQKGVMIICLIASLFMVHNGYVQHQTWDGSGWAAGTKLVEKIRITYVGIFNDPNDIAMLFVMSMPFAAYFIAKSNFIMKIIFMAVLAALIYGVFLTNSRGGLLGIFSLMACYFLFRYGVKKTIITGLITGPVFLVVMSKFRTIEQGESANGRVEAWYVGLYEMYRSSPVFGVGKGMFADIHTHTAHNSFILVIAELGFVGYFLWLATLIISIVMVGRTVLWYKKIPDNEKLKLSEDIKTEAHLSAVLLFSFIGYLATCFFLSRSYIVILFVFMGMAIATYYRTIKLVPELEIKSYGPYYSTIFKLTFLSIIGFFILVKLLL